MCIGYIWQKFWSIQKFMKERNSYVFIIWKKFIMKKKKYMCMKVYLYEWYVSRICGVHVPSHVWAIFILHMVLLFVVDTTRPLSSRAAAFEYTIGCQPASQPASQPGTCACGIFAIAHGVSWICCEILQRFAYFDTNLTQFQRATKCCKILQNTFFHMSKILQNTAKYCKMRIFRPAVA